MFHLLSFNSSSSANWYWGQCLHKPLFPDKKGGGKIGAGGKRKRRGEKKKKE